MAGFTIEIKKNTTLDTIDEYYDIFNKARAVEAKIDVQLPVEFTQNYLGLVPALLQFVITWARYERSETLLIDITNTEPDTVEELYKNELIFPVVILIWSTHDIVNSDRKNLKGFLNFKNREFMAKMLTANSIAHKLLLTNFDHLADDYQLPCFGNRYEFVSTEYSLQQNLKDGIRDVFYYSQLGPEFINIYPDFIAIIYELMKNTFEWGKEDENNVPLANNIRGVLFKFFKKRRHNLLNEYGWHTGLSNYFKSAHLRENDQGELYFVEVSIFDGGIGFARKFRSTKPEFAEHSEIDVLKLCLIKHKTSSRGLEKDDKGLGLDRILQVLDGKGFLRIKTGELCVYRDLIQNRYANPNDVKDMVLCDWKTKKSNRFTNFKRSEGSVITIVYPLSVNPS